MQTQQIMTEVHSNTVNEYLPRTIMHNILRAGDLPPAEKDFDRVNDEVDTITSAGLETVAQTLRFMIHRLHTNSIFLHRLPPELQDMSTTLNPDPKGEPTLTQLEHLPCLTAVIIKGLRLSPGAASGLARISPDRELMYDGNTVIPAGTPVSMTTLLMHRDARVYPEAQRFEPERWMDEERVKKAEKTFAPFSRGRRICLSMQ